jgi:hypothetical protein
VATTSRVAAASAADIHTADPPEPGRIVAIHDRIGKTDMPPIETIVEIAVRLARANSTQDEAELCETLTKALMAESYRDEAIDPATFVPRFNFALKQSSWYTPYYARTLPAYDASRISRVSAERTPPGDLVTLSADGWSSGECDLTTYRRTIGDVSWSVTYADGQWTVTRAHRGTFTSQRSKLTHATAAEAIAEVAEWIRADRRLTDLPLAA